MKALAPVRTVAPSADLIDLTAAKAHLRVDSSDEDAEIAALVAAATSHLDGYSGVLGRALLLQTWSQSFDGFPAGDCLRLPLGPLVSVTSLAYFDSAGAAQTFTAFHAVSDALGPKIVLQDGATWPGTATRPDAVTVTWTCGHSEIGYVPKAIVHAAKLLVGHWYYNREAIGSGAMSELPLTVRALLAPFSRVGV